MEVPEPEQELGLPSPRSFCFLSSQNFKHLTSCSSHHLRVPLVPSFSYPNPSPSSKAILELSSSSTLCSSNSSGFDLKWSCLYLPCHLLIMYLWHRFLFICCEDHVSLMRFYKLSAKAIQFFLRFSTSVIPKVL